MRKFVGRAYFEIVDTLEDNNKKILVNFYDKSYWTLFEHLDIYTGRKSKLSTCSLHRGDILLDEDKVVRAAWGWNILQMKRFSITENQVMMIGSYICFVRTGDGSFTVFLLPMKVHPLVLCSINNPITGVCHYYPE